MGVWIETCFKPVSITDCFVTPFVGVWIETVVEPDNSTPSASHPSWVCGLKQDEDFAKSYGYAVTPFVGVWIETKIRSCRC